MTYSSPFPPTTSTDGLNETTKNGLCYNGNISSPAYVQPTNYFIFDQIMLPSFMLTCLMIIIGLPGNLLVIYIYLRKWRKNTTRIFILALAGFDFVNCLLMPYEAAHLRNVILFDFDGSCKFTRMMTFTLNNASSFTLVAIAIDRNMRICHILKPQLTIKMSKYVVMACIVVSMLIAIPAGIMYGTRTLYIPISKTPGFCVVGKSCLTSDSYYGTKWQLYFIIFTTVGHILIDLLLIICYGQICFTVFSRGDFQRFCKNTDQGSSFSHQSTSVDNIEVYVKPPGIGPASFQSYSGRISQDTHEKGAMPSEIAIIEHVPLNQIPPRNMSFASSSTRKMSAASKRSAYQRKRSLSVSSIENRKGKAYKTTFMLLMVTILFITAFFPYTVIMLKTLTDKTYYYRLSLSGKAAYNLFLRFYLLNSALNPVIYSFFSEQFRRECKNVFKRMTCRPL